MGNEMGLIKYCTVYKAAIADDWEAARLIFEEERNVFLAFTYFNENNPYTPLHIAVATNCSHRFVQELVEWIMRVGDVQMLRFRDTAGHSALHYAAIVGNTQDARLLIDADPELAQMSSIKGWTALTLAAACRRKEAVNYLLQVTKDVINEEGTSPYRGELGADLLLYTIHSDFYDVALYLVKKYPDLVTERNTVSGQTALEILARKPNAFPSGRIPVDKETTLAAEPSEVITTQDGTHKTSYGAFAFFWRVSRYLGAISTAVKSGIYELIEQCCLHYPAIIGYQVEGLNLVMAAISERQEKVYNLVYQMSAYKVFTSSENTPLGNALHIAGKLAPLHRLNTVTGAALQMQRELQWFKEVEKFVLPTRRTQANFEHKTPRMVFTSEHKELLQEAKLWMKDTSSSATVVAALIVTIAFSAIFTAPGGNDNNGKPLFLNDGVFILFAISDAIALFSSSTSVMMLLAVLSSRFAEEDFLYSLPKRLTLGLISLFISIAAIMVSFSATLSLVLRDKIQWIAAPVVLLAVVPVTLFLLLQYPLLVELVRSTYGRGIFYKQNDLLLH
ncbi:hypothetical protein DCAR_0623832 [Daucus carota subsp. sativus]|uniref:PGG domain-containing protein n=1 Tax=Daucus carota subsp. sativus TaxID=79200 RepID=A0A164VG05_DAUCS|nr:hypothetical protein DCAR_0623832 [Daucus carota subsp. sativus]